MLLARSRKEETLHPKIVDKNNFFTVLFSGFAVLKLIVVTTSTSHGFTPFPYVRFHAEVSRPMLGEVSRPMLKSLALYVRERYRDLAPYVEKSRALC